MRVDDCESGRELKIKPVGVVESENRIRIFSEYSDALEGVKEGMWIWVLYFFHRAGEKLKVHPRGDISRPLRGVFSTRSPERPNRIGMSLARLLHVEGELLLIDGIDALEGSPVIDIKPYTEYYDVPGAVLSADDIRKRIENENLIRDYIDLATQLQPNGFDCTLRSVSKIEDAGLIDFDNAERRISSVKELVFQDDKIFLEPGVYRANLNEVIKLGDDIMAFARPRSSLIRCGVNVLTAVWDAGYEGRSEVGIVVHNQSGVWLKKNARIVQLVFIKLTSRTRGYSGVYRGENV
jgi:dUTP pyrophosphatase